MKGKCKRVGVAALLLLLLFAFSVPVFAAEEDTLADGSEQSAIPCGVNAAGETYGITMNGKGEEPDLISAVATNGKTGYIRVSEMFPDLPTTLEEAAVYNETHQDPRPIPVYESDGITVIGEIIIGAGQCTQEITPADPKL